MEEREFAPVRFIPGKKNGKYPFCHSVYVNDAKILIDPASDRERLIRLKAEDGVEAVWLSHWHEDHITDLDLFDDVPLWISEADALPLSNMELFLDAYDMHGAFRDEWKAVMEKQFHYKPRTPQRRLTGGETLDLGPVTVDVISTPGHTPGHLSFFFREPAVLFLGDYDLTPFGPWYGDRDSDVDDVLDSVELLRRVPAKVWISGHETGLFEEEPGALWDAYVGVIHRRETRLMDMLHTPKTMSQIVDAGIVYNRPGTTRDFIRFGEAAIMSKHLERGMKNGAIVQHNDYYVRA